MTIDVPVRIDARLYQRDLPGGGYVAIERATYMDGDHESPHLRVCVERRESSDRRSGHQPPVIVEMELHGSNVGFADLYNIAADNVAIARALLDWQRRPRAD